MNWRNGIDRYRSLSIGLHWLMLVLIAGVYACIELREYFPKGSDPREAFGAVLPLVVVYLVPSSALMWAVSATSLLFLALLGSVSARAGGSPVLVAAARVTFWGAIAMALTAGVGALFGVAV